MGVDRPQNLEDLPLLCSPETQFVAPKSTQSRVPSGTWSNRVQKSRWPETLILYVVPSSLTLSWEFPRGPVDSSDDSSDWDVRNVMSKRCVKKANIATRRRSEVPSAFSNVDLHEFIGPVDENESLAHIGFADMTVPSS